MHSPASIPCSSHVLELTMPMEAVAAAPICPTMAASMYSMAVATVSSGASGRVLAWMRIILRRLGQPGLAEHLTMHIVRKLAHFCEYMLEGFLLMLCMRVYSRHPLRHITVPMLGGVLTALTDETIQLFSEVRSRQVTDVWLYSAGVLAGILVAIVLLLACEGLYYHMKRRHE